MNYPQGAAKRMYPDMYKQGETKSASILGSDSSMPESRTSGEAARSDSEIAKGFYSPASLYQSMQASDSNRMRDEGYSEKGIAEINAEHAGVFSSLRVPIAEAGKLNSLLVTHKLKPATREQIDEWTRQTRRALREKYGVAEAETRLKAACKYVSGDSKLSASLSRSGLGSHPDVVMKIAERADELNYDRARKGAK